MILPSISDHAVQKFLDWSAIMSIDWTKKITRLAAKHGIKDIMNQSFYAVMHYDTQPCDTIFHAITTDEEEAERLLQSWHKYFEDFHGGYDHDWRIELDTVTGFADKYLFVRETIFAQNAPKHFYKCLTAFLERTSPYPKSDPEAENQWLAQENQRLTQENHRLMEVIKKL